MTLYRQSSRSKLAPLLLALLLGALGGYFLYRVFHRETPAYEARLVTPRGDLAEDEKSTIELFRRTSPSVVFITTLAQRINIWTRNVTEIPQGTGSGFVWDTAGTIVTNFHVVQNASSARVSLSDHGTYSAKVVGVAPEYDLAILRINAPPEKLPPLPVGRSNDLQVGQKVFAIGNPFGLDQTLTTGIVSALGRTIQSVTNQPIEDVIQTDAAINPGNSGGPLLDSAGRLIGVNTAIYSPSGSSAGIGFAVPVDTVNRIIPQLVKNGRVIRPSIDVVTDDQIGRRITRQLGVDGVLVLGVPEGSEAQKAGLHGTQQTQDGGLILGDIIQSIDGKPLRSLDEMYRLLQRYKVGDSVKVLVLREGKPVAMQVKLQPDR